VDEVACPADTTVCTVDRCNTTTRSCGVPAADGTQCGSESPFTDLRASAYACQAGACRYAYLHIMCTQTTNTGCNTYEMINGQMDVDLASSVSCNGNRLDYRQNMQNVSRSCPGGCARFVVSGSLAYYYCY